MTSGSSMLATILTALPQRLQIVISIAVVQFCSQCQQCLQSVWRQALASHVETHAGQ